MDNNTIQGMNKADFWTVVQEAWIHDRLHSTDARAHITPKHSTFQKIVEYFKGAKYVVKEDGNNVNMEIIHPRYITSSTSGHTGLIREMEIMLIDDTLEARIRLNVPLTEDWIIRACKDNGNGYKFNMLKYDGYKISNGKAA
jgi:hypothetical protein